MVSISKISYNIDMFKKGNNLANSKMTNPLHYMFAPRTYNYADECAGITEFEIPKKTKPFTYETMLCVCGHINTEHQKRSIEGCVVKNCRCERFNYDEINN